MIKSYYQRVVQLIMGGVLHVNKITDLAWKI